MKDLSFDDVFKIDMALYKLAHYEVSGGMIIIPRSQDELFKLEEKIADKFNYFKKMIQSGECTYDFIRCNVLEKNGAFFKDKKELEEPTNIKTWEEEYTVLKENNAKNEIQEISGFVSKLLGNLKLEDKPPISLNPMPKTDEKKKKRKSKKS